jgi:hypothetical protein
MDRVTFQLNPGCTQVAFFDFEKMHRGNPKFRVTEFLNSWKNDLKATSYVVDKAE